MTDIVTNIEDFHVENKYRLESGIAYPPFCKVVFERYFYEYITKQFNEGKVKETIYQRYVPVYWTEIQITKKYDNLMVSKIVDESNMEIYKLWYLIQNLPDDKQYFTVVQHDDGITFSSLKQNLITFAMGGRGNIPIPLTYENPELFNSYKNTPKTEFCSFVGSNTHPCREKMINALKDKPDVLIITDAWTNDIHKDKQKLYLDVISKSRFTLAPRGYGKTSFRLYEALRMNSIPVYIYDEHWLPYREVLDWNRLCILIPIDQIEHLYDVLKNITDDQINDMLNYYKTVEKYFTYDGMCEYIINVADQIIN